MPKSVARREAVDLLTDYLSSRITVKEIISKWPTGYVDQLLDDIINEFLEQVSPEVVSDEDIALTGIRAIENNWNSALFYDSIEKKGK